MTHISEPLRTLIRNAAAKYGCASPAVVVDTIAPDDALVAETASRPAAPQTLREFADEYRKAEWAEYMRAYYAMQIAKREGRSVNGYNIARKDMTPEERAAHDRERRRLAQIERRANARLNAGLEAMIEARQAELDAKAVNPNFGRFA
ncbi:MAG: hypothetical protein KL801_12575 [Mesorhizobium sp.]|nr:hypothetical protein [Mesorhizobium sp.]